MLLSLAEWFQI